MAFANIDAFKRASRDREKVASTDLVLDSLDTLCSARRLLRQHRVAPAATSHLGQSQFHTGAMDRAARAVLQQHGVSHVVAGAGTGPGCRSAAVESALENIGLRRSLAAAMAVASEEERAHKSRLVVPRRLRYVIDRKQALVVRPPALAHLAGEAYRPFRPPAGPWTCGQCSRVNSKSMYSCPVCATAHRRQWELVAGMAKSTDALLSWRCHVCGNNNAAGVDPCGVCGLGHVVQHNRLKSTRRRDSAAFGPGIVPPRRLSLNPLARGQG